MKPFDIVLYIVVGLGAVVLASVGLCAADWVWAAATVLVVISWSWLLYRKIHQYDDPEEE